MTLVFSPAQAILAAEIGAYIVSPFLGRIDDVAADGMDVLRKICDIYEIQGYETQVLAASLRHPMHIVESALAGADIATMPFGVFTQLVKHPLTDIGLEKFLEGLEGPQEQELEERSLSGYDRQERPRGEGRRRASSDGGRPRHRGAQAA